MPKVVLNVSIVSAIDREQWSIKNKTSDKAKKNKKYITSQSKLN